MKKGKVVKEQLVMRKDDYEILKTFLKGWTIRNSFDRHNAEELETELKKAKLVNKEKFPKDVVRLNSKVIIKEEKEDRVIEVMLVTPDKADIKQRKISIMSPVGIALIGFRKGQRIKWDVPSGKKTFTIMEVINQYG